MDPINFGLWRFQQNVTTSIPSNISVNKSARVLYNYDADTTLLYFINNIQNTDTWEQTTEFAIQRTEDLSTLQNVTDLSTPSTLANLYRFANVYTSLIDEYVVHYDSDLHDFEWLADTQLVDHNAMGSPFAFTPTIASHTGSNGTWVDRNVNVTLPNYLAAQSRQLILNHTVATDLHAYVADATYTVAPNSHFMPVPSFADGFGGPITPAGALVSSDDTNFVPADIKLIDYTRYDRFRNYLTVGTDLVDDGHYAAGFLPGQFQIVENADTAKWFFGPGKTMYNNNGYVVSNISNIANYPSGLQYTSNDSFHYRYHPVHYFNDNTKQFLLCEDGYLLRSTDMWSTFTGGYFTNFDYSGYNYCNAIWANGNNVVVIMRNGHCYTSSDSGITFTLSTAIVDKIKANASALGHSSATNWSERYISQVFSNSFMMDTTLYVVISDLLFLSQDFGTTWNISRLSGGNFCDWVFKGPAGDVYIKGNNTSPFRIYNSSTSSWPPDVSALSPVSGDNTLRNVNNIFYSSSESKYLAFDDYSSVYEVPSTGGILTGGTPTTTNLYDTQMDTANYYTNSSRHSFSNIAQLQAYSQLEPGVYSRHTPKGMGAAYTLDVNNSARKFYYLYDYITSNTADVVGGSLAAGPMGGNLNNPIFFGQWLYAWESPDSGSTATHTTRFSPVSTLPTAQPRYYLEDALHFSTNIIPGGTGYTDPTVTISAPDQPGGRQAIGFVQTSADILSRIYLTDVGSGYTAPATYTITDPTGSGAAETGTITNVSYLDYIDITDPDGVLLHPYENTVLYIGPMYPETIASRSASLSPLQLTQSIGITAAFTNLYRDKVLLDNGKLLTYDPVESIGQSAIATVPSLRDPKTNRHAMLLDPSDGSTELVVKTDLYTNLPAHQIDFYPININGTYSQFTPSTATSDPYLSFGDIQVGDVANQYDSGKTYLQPLYFWQGNGNTDLTVTGELWLMTFDTVSEQFTLRDKLHTNSVTYTDAYTDFQQSWNVYNMSASFTGAKTVTSSGAKSAEWMYFMNQNVGGVYQNSIKITTDSGATFTDLSPIDLGDGNQVFFNTYNDREDKWIGVAQPITYGGSQINGSHDIYIADDPTGTNMSLMATTPSSMSY